MTVFLFTLSLLALGNALTTTPTSRNPPVVVVFGRPGAGKTTVADCAIELLLKEQSDDPAAPVISPIGCDLDVCVPQWMRDNFAKGMYPTIEQRKEFALECCDYVDKCLREEAANGCPETDLLAGVVSFSFVNTDLRDVFRSRFPESKWVLIDTTDQEAKRRIEQRQGHFYKGTTETLSESDDETVVEETQAAATSKQDNSDWEFAPVTFPHVVLEGTEPLEKNAEQVAKILARSFDLN